MRSFLTLFFIVYAGVIFASPKEIKVEATGDAIVVNDDIASAKAIAISRAKWQAIEIVSPTKIKIDTIINNSHLADEAVKAELSATINSFNIISEEIKDNRYIVKIEAYVSPHMAEEISNSLMPNASLCVMVAGVEPSNKMLSFNNAFSMAIIDYLQEKSFDIDIIDYKNIKSADYNKAFTSTTYSNIKNIIKNKSCKNLLLGKLSVSDMGSDVGYGQVSFKLVSGDVTWKLISIEGNNITQLKSGSFSGRGQGATMDDAVVNLYKNMASSTAIKLSSQVAEAILGDNYKSIRVVLLEHISIDDLGILKNYLKNIPFVLEVREQGGNSFIVNYPEKTYYLAVFLERDKKYKVVKLSDNELIIRK